MIFNYGDQSNKWIRRSQEKESYGKIMPQLSIFPSHYIRYPLTLNQPHTSFLNTLFKTLHLLWEKCFSWLSTYTLPIISSTIWCSMRCLEIFRPLVLGLDSSFLFRSEVIWNVQVCADLFWGLVLNEAGDSCAAEVKQWLDIHKVSSEGQIKQSLLIESGDKVGIEWLN